MSLEIGTPETLIPEIVDGTEQVPAQEPTGLVTIHKGDVQTVFTSDNGLDPIITAIEKEVRSFVPDLTTATGRKAIASLAHKVSRSKVYIDSMGKDLVASMKELPKKIDANRKVMRDRLDALAEEARRPLTEWEAEQERIERERLAHEAEIALAAEIEMAHEIGLLMNEKFDRDKADRIERERRDQEERDSRIAREASEKAQREAAERAESERNAAALRDLQAKQEIERLERERVAAEERARKDREESAAREEQARVDAATRERERIAEERRKEEQDRLARERDKEHRKQLNNQALEDLIAATGIDPEKAKAVIAAIAMKKIRNITINY